MRGNHNTIGVQISLCIFSLTVAEVPETVTQGDNFCTTVIRGLESDDPVGSGGNINIDIVDPVIPLISQNAFVWWIAVSMCVQWAPSLIHP